MITVASGQIRLTNLNDTKMLNLYISTNQPKTQMYNSGTGAYTPDWTTNKPVLTAELYVAGTSTNIIASAKSIAWYDGGSAISSGTAYTLGASNQTLTINQNVMSSVEKKVFTCTVVYTDTDTNYDVTVQGTIDFTKTLVGQKGAQGDAVAMAYLTNDSATVATNNDGSGGSYGTNTSTTLKIFLGATDVTSQYTIAQTRSNVTVTEATTSATASVTAMSADSGSVTFTATRSGYPTITRTFYLFRNKMGTVGQTPTNYWLTPSTNTISVADDGTYTPANVVFTASAQSGTSAPTAYAGRFTVSESTDGTNFTTKYTSAANESSITYSPSQGISVFKVTLYLAGGTSTILDEQKILMINDGKNSVTLSAWTPGGDVIRNGGNNVTAQADLYNGGVAVSGDNYRWVRQNGAATSAIAGAGYEDLDLGKRNLLKNSSREVTSVNEFVKYADIAPIFDQYGLVPYTISFDIKSANISQKNTVQVYQQNGSGAKYYFTKNVNVTTEYTRQYITVTPTLADNTLTESWLAFYGTYGTGNIPTIKNVKVELGAATASSNTDYQSALEDVRLDQANNNLYNKNWTVNGDVKQYQTKTDVGWDNTLNGTLIPSSGWSSGYNGGVTDPTHGYHAHVNTSVFGYPVFEFIDKNSIISQPHRWLGFSQTVTAYGLTFEKGKTYTVSFEARTDTANMRADLGFYHYKDDGSTSTPSFYGFEWTFPMLPTPNVWVKQYQTFTVDSVWDVTKSATIYVYGNKSSVEGTLWVKNIKVEEGAYATDFTNQPLDNAASYPTQTNGVNSWIFRYYDSPTIPYSGNYTALQNVTPTYQTIIADRTDVTYSLGQNYYGYLKTALYTSTAKSITLSFKHDDGATIYINGTQVYYGASYTSTAVTRTFSLQAGWNSFEVVYKQGTGGDGFNNVSPLLSTLVDEMNCNYSFDYGSLLGKDGILGYNTSSMIVTPAAVTDMDSFRCLATYRGTVYAGDVTIEDVSDPITMEILGSRIFKNGQGTNSYTAVLYQNGAPIDNDGTQYTYTWYVYKQDGSKDMTFGGSGSKTGKTITLLSSNISVRGRLMCSVT